MKDIHQFPMLVKKHLVSFSRARAFPCASGSQHHRICRYRVKSTNKKVDMADPSFCLGCRKCCAKYGAVSDSATLSEDDVEFDDWHLTFTFEQQSV